MRHRRRIKTIFVLFLFLIAGAGCGQHLSQVRLAELADDYAVRSFPLFYDLLSIPNDGHYPEHVAANLEFVQAAFQDRGFEMTVLKTAGPPLLLASRKTSDKKPTVLVYLQIDGQPVDSYHWDQKSPYTPTLKRKLSGKWDAIPWESLSGEIDREWRIFARSSSDAKGPVAMFLAALDAHTDLELPMLYNLKVIMDFEEELGSPNLPGAVKTYSDELAADMLVIYDGPRHNTNRPTLSFGARGISTMTLTVYGPRVAQHSGHFGNYVPNPAVRLAQIIASMKDADGRVLIPGFYDGVRLSDEVEAILAQVPDDKARIDSILGIAASDKVAPTLQEALQYPSLNVRGMVSAWTGEKARTIIPDKAVAELDLRLVPEVEAERLLGLVGKHIENQGYFLLANREPTEAERLKHPRIASFNARKAYAAFQTPYDSRVGKWLTRALTRAFGEPPVRLRMMGGSIPISPFVTTLDIPAVIVPTVNRDNNQHSPNENIRVGNYIDGIATFLAILTEEI